MTALQRAKAYIRGEGWTISGNRAKGYDVGQCGELRTMTERELLAFAGMDETPQTG